MSAQADFDLKERVRSAVDLVDVVSATLELRPQGRNFVARCPWHDDRRPSLNINPERQSWKCWVCDIGGDVFSFVMQRDGLEFPEALRHLAQVAGIEVPERFGPRKLTQSGQPDDRQTLLDAVESVAAEYEAFLVSDDPDAAIARAYLDQRQIDDSMRRAFRIGMSPDQWTWATDRLARKKFSSEVAVAAGMASPRRKGDGCVDMFRGRLMFPITDVSGKVISMGGRVLPAIAERSGKDVGGKYINGRETMLFRKSSTLYGLNLAKDFIRKAKSALVMEGYTDVIAAHAAGVQNAVAVLGTALTESHVRLLKRFAPKIVLVLDGDAAGMRRADEILDLFAASDVDLRILTLPMGSDPADFLRDHGCESLLEMVDAAPDALEHRLSRIREENRASETHDIASAADRLLRTMSAAPDGLKIDHMLTRMADALGFEIPRLQRRLEFFRERSGGRPPSVRGGTVVPSVDRPRRAAALPPIRGVDRELFLCLFQSPELAAHAIEAISPDWLETTTAMMLMSAFQDLEMEGHDLTVDALMIVIENESLKNELVSMLDFAQREQSRRDSDIAKQYESVMSHYTRRRHKQEATEVIEQLSSAALDEDAELNALKELFDQERRRQPG